LQESIIATQQRRIEGLEEDLGACQSDLAAERRKVYAMLRRLDRLVGRERGVEW
jgi:hypothetical protein